MACQHILSLEAEVASGPWGFFAFFWAGGRFLGWLGQMSAGKLVTQIVCRGSLMRFRLVFVKNFYSAACEHPRSFLVLDEFLSVSL